MESGKNHPSQQDDEDLLMGINPIKCAVLNVM